MNNTKNAFPVYIYIYITPVTLESHVFYFWTHGSPARTGHHPQESLIRVPSHRWSDGLRFAPDLMPGFEGVALETR